MSNNPIFLAVLAIAVFAIVATGIHLGYVAKQDCEARGGALVRGIIGLACVKGVTP